MQQNDKLEELLQKVMERGANDSRSFLSTNHYLIFLLIGASAEDRTAFGRTVERSLINKGACAFIYVSKQGLDIEEQVKKAHRAAADAHVVDNLKHVVVSAVLYARMPEDGILASVTAVVTDYFSSRNIETLWAPFLFLLTEEKAVLQEWLHAVSQSSKQLEQRFLRCCVLSQYDEDELAVKDEQNLNVAILLSILLASSDEMQKAILHRLMKQQGEDGGNCYTVRGVSLSNPYKTQCISRLLAAIRSFNGYVDATAEKAEVESLVSRMDMLKIGVTLSTLFAQMPSENGAVSMLPFLGVMEGTNLQERLLKLAREHYFLEYLTGNIDTGLLDAATTDLLQEFFRNGGTLKHLNRICEQSDESKEHKSKIANKIAAAVAKPLMCSLPAGIRFTGQIDAFVGELARAIGAYGGLSGGKITAHDSVLCTTRYQRSKDLSARIDALVDELQLEARALSGVDVSLPCGIAGDGNAEEAANKWIADMRSNQPGAFDASRYNAMLGIYQQLISEKPQYEQALSAQLEAAYNLAQDATYNAEEYMNAVSQACANNVTAKDCVKKIEEDNLKLPLRVNNLGGANEFLCILGNEQNNLFLELRKILLNTRQRAGCSQGLSRNDRLEILRLSHVFRFTDILTLGINKYFGTSKPAGADMGAGPAADTIYISMSRGEENDDWN